MAAVDYFLKIDGIEGETQQKGHEKEIELKNFSHGVSNHGSSDSHGGGGAGKASFQDFTFGMEVQKASNKLFLACCAGEHIKSAVFTARKAGKEQQEFLKWKFTDLLISSYHQSGGGGEVKPLEQISFNFAKIEIDYKVQNADGTLGGSNPAGWNLKMGVKV